MGNRNLSSTGKASTEVPFFTVRVVRHWTGCPVRLWMPPPWRWGQAGWGFEQPGLEGGVPAYSRELELRDLNIPFQTKPFYDSMIYHQFALAQGQPQRHKVVDEAVSSEMTKASLQGHLHCHWQAGRSEMKFFLNFYVSNLKLRCWRVWFMCLQRKMIIIFQHLSEAPEMKQEPNNAVTSQELNCLFILRASQ